MHALLITFGTDGDVFPYVNLGRRLVARGHRVTLATTEQYQPLADQSGFEFRPLMPQAEVDAVLENPDIWHPLRTALIASRWGTQFIEPCYRLLAELAAEDDETVLVGNPGALAARLLQEKRRLPMVSVILQPWLIPSSSAPPVLPGVTLPHWAPRPLAWLYWRMVDGVGDFLISRSLNRICVSLELPRVRRIFRWWLSPDRVIGMFPPWYGPPQDDWPPQVRLAGFPLDDGRGERTLPDELQGFLDADGPPVAFTFGTGMMHSEDLFRAACEACRLIGKRGLLLTRHADQLPDPLPGHMRHCAYAPFDKLFPRCAAVVHHGGIGTTAKALAAGTPQLILPFAFDQQDNARRVERLGVGGWLGRRRRKPADLAAAIERLQSPGTAEACQSAAARFAEEDPLEQAVDWIEETAAAGFVVDRSAIKTLVRGANHDSK